jgi:hypothetical protein
LARENKACNKQIKAQIEYRITRSITNKKLLKDKSPLAIVAINNFIFPDCEKLKLKTIAKKLSFSETFSR